MSDLAPISPAVINVYEGARQEVVNRYGDHLQAVYLIGSLAHGGFSESTSDIDVAFILDKPDITSEDWDAFSEAEAIIKNSQLRYGRRLSVFWSTHKVLESTVTSGAFPVPTREHGVFPPYDVLDLIQNGVLIYGNDKRESFRTPTEDELYVAGVEFLLSYVNTENNNLAITDYLKFDELSNHDKSKLILFPVRLMYTLGTGSVGDNEVAANDYLRGLSATWATGGFTDADHNTYQLINQALSIRESDTYDASSMQANFAGLQDLYQKLISQHATKMRALNKPDYALELETWKDSLRLWV